MKNLEKFAVYGINHNELDLLERESFVYNFKPHKKLKELLDNNMAIDGLLLSTCLRNEFYFWDEKDQLSESFLGIKGLFIKNGIDALEHLFKVTCGFDSAIPGEEQILAQVKKAYIEKIEKGERPSPINTVFNKAIALGKKFRTISRINENSISVEALGIKEAEKHLDNLKDKNIFIIGAGEIASSLVKILHKKSCKNISVIKRKNCMIHEKVDFYSFDDKFPLLYEADVIFSTTSAPHYIFEKKDLDLELMGNKERVFIDFAVPRDIDPQIGEIYRQNLYNLEDLNKLAQNSYARRQEICREFKPIIDLGIEKTLEWSRRRHI